MHHKQRNICFQRRSKINRKKLRIILCTTLTIVLLFTLCSCSSGIPEVPDQLIRDVVDSKYAHKDYHYTAEHNMDNSTHIDTITIKVVVPREYCNEHIIATCKYRYNKSNDTWDIYGDTTWKNDRLEYLAHKFTTIWDGNFKNSGGSYNANITSVDFEKGTITGRFSASYSYISLGGSRHSYTLEAEGTYPIEEDYDGYWLKITQSGCTFTFLLSPHYGFTGIVAKAI